MDHAELIAELPRIEALTPQERLRLAKERRALQLRRCLQLEKEQEGRRKSAVGLSSKKKILNSRRIKFPDTIRLLEAAARNDIDEVRRLLEHGVDPNSKNEDGLTALHQSCIDNNEEMLLLLLRSGANVNAEDTERWTPLHAAATCGHKRLVDILLRKGANLLAVNSDGNMPYDICDDEETYYFIESEMARRGITQEIINRTRAAPEEKMLNDLKECRANREDLDFVNDVGATPLHVAAANGYLKIAEFLLECGVNTEVRDADGWQPVHAAACWGHLDVLELLVQNGANLSALTDAGESPLEICEDKEMRERIIQLRQETRVLKEQSLKPRRSSSTVRRSSIHKKNLTSKKDVMNEGLTNRLRIENETKNERNNKSESKTDDSPPMAHLLKRDTLGEIKLDEKDREKMKQAADHSLKKEKGQQNSVQTQSKGWETNDRGNNEARRSIDNDPYRNSVASTPKTLTELKTERRRSRGQSIDGEMTTVQTIYGQKVTETYYRPPSPNANFNKFTGEPLEIVGDNKGRRCCVIM
ncbi:protein phosphatase 1 regulatory inhibitor subunit 16B-like isoform X2 [Artemia franciscana]|uniref:protein phosphatase 1 regulatory inhibitor subunit 16B-like isoform X2 n=1 Tax=Artemia franciscana TaxID=6661 RepID=UPI0032DBB2A9